MRIYNHALNDATGEVEEPESNTKITGCKGFSTFSKEIRPQCAYKHCVHNYCIQANFLKESFNNLQH